MKTKFDTGLVAGGIVALMIVGVLVALLLPAVQSAREGASRRSAIHTASTKSEVRGDMGQYGLAAHSLHETLKAPAGATVVAGELPAERFNVAPSDRKIIYSATIDLVVEDFAGVHEKVVALVKKFDGYVADSNVTGASGDSRRANWKIRVPIARFDDFVQSSKDLGELVSAATNSQDVSEEYYDVDARIRNKTKEEERLLKLLEDRPGKLEDVIAIERELSRVREELERMQGRMRVLADRTSLTSVQLQVTEVHNYQPEQAATFGTRIRRAFGDSLMALATAVEAMIILCVALLPWLAVFAVLVGASYPIGRLLLRKITTPPSPAG